ncbi:acyltransferase [Sphingobacterium suaedae]|uniref:Acyltransferase n=1 Tax=Sphingobacterium suaedae TaxID=1686402 RepID=A0ABW5KQ69_9SPHI
MQRQPIYYISALRVLATFLVILIHASTGYLNRFSADGFDWHYANILHSFSRFSVPLFVMLSGALLLPKNEDTCLFYRKRMIRVLLPFLFWLVVYLVYYFYRYTPIDVLLASRIVEISLDKLLHGPSAHLWFLYMILGLYLAVPFLQKIVVQASQKEILIFIGLWMLSLLLLNKKVGSYLPSLDLTFFSGYVGYLVFGYYLAARNIALPIAVSLSLVVCLGGLNTWGTYLLSLQQGAYDPALYNYLGLNNVLLAGSVFLLFKQLIRRPIPRWAQAVDLYSFGIYLIHILLLNYIHPLIIAPTVLKVPIAALLTLALSILAIYLLRRLPFGKYVSG